MTTDSASVPDGVLVVKAILIACGVGLVVYALLDHPFYGGPPGIGLLQKLILAAGAALFFGAFLPKRFAEQLLLLTISSLLVLGIAEVAGNSILGPMFRPIYQEDPELIFRFIPDRKSTARLPPINGGATITHRINSAGFRGEELQERTSERKRIVVYGDSFIHAYYATDADTFPVQLQADLESEAGQAIEVINAGVSSYGPDQISAKLQKELPVLKPDLVVVAIFSGNDYSDLMRNKMFRLDEDGKLIGNHWRLDPLISEAFSLSQRESILVRALRTTVAGRKSATAASSNSTKVDLERLVTDAQGEYQSLISGDPLVTNTHLDYYSADVSLLPNSDSARYKVTMMRRVLEQIRRITDRAGLPVVFLFIPHPADLTDTYDWGAVDMTKYPDYNGRNQIAPLEHFATETSSHFVSLFDLFRTNDPNRLYFHGGDDHWSPAGQALAAKVVSQYISSQGLLRSP